MSAFCENAKNEILNAPLRSRREKLAFLSAYSRASGVLELRGSDKRFLVRCENPNLKNLLTDILGDLYKGDIESDKNSIAVYDPLLYKLLGDLKILYKDKAGELIYETGIHADFIADTAVSSAYLRGLFLGAGALSLSQGYHLEFAFSNENLAKNVSALVANIGVTLKSVGRQGKTVAYIKDQESVSDLLAYMGAAKAVLELNGISVERDANRVVNRRLNCDIANIDKTVVLSAAQIDAIKKLEKSGALKNLDEKLRGTAELRLKYPEASLNDLAELCGVSKSGIRHRLDKLVELSK